MFKRLIVFIAAVIFSSSLRAQIPPDNPPSEAELAQITARGRALAGYDAAAWHASDAVMAVKPAEGEIQLYLARQAADGWIVEWGRYNQDKSKFIIVYEAIQNGATDEYKVKKLDPPLEDSDVVLRMARARDLATNQFLQDLDPKRQYNISILPATSGNWFIYAIPAQTQDAILPYGGDIRYTVSSDGTKIIEKRQMHKAILEERTGQLQFDFHTHILSDVPEDSDVFYALTRKASNGEWICTQKFTFGITPAGSLSYVGKTKEILKLLEDGKSEVIPEQQRPMAVAALKRLMNPPTATDPLDADISFVGSRCVGNTLQLRLFIVVHNNTDRTIILHKSALHDAQARFAGTDADIFAGKYDKLVYISPIDSDFSDQNSFLTLAPGKNYGEIKEFPIIGLDLTGKSVMQFLFFAWPVISHPSEKDTKEFQHARWAQTGDLFSDTIVSGVAPLAVDPMLAKGCSSK